MTNIQPLQNRVQIVKEDGTPTDFFIRWAKQRQIDISAGITAAEAQALIDAWALARDVNAGVGLSGGGNLSTDITVDLENTAVTPGSYNSADITVDAQGRITAAANGASVTPLEVEDEGVSVEIATTKLNFIGAGVTATNPAAGEVDVTIPGGAVTFPLIADVTGMAEPQFEIYADGGGIQANITATSYGTGLNGGGIFHSRYARGTRASPTAVQSGDITGGYGGRWCYDAGLFHVSSPVSIHFQTTQNQTPSAWGSWLRLLTTPKGSTARQERGGVTDNGTFWSHDTATYDSALSEQTQPFPDARFVASASVSVSGGSSFAAVGYGTGCTPGFRGGNARGTAAAPSATQNTDLLCFMGGHGYASGWTAGTKALIGFYAAENWTATEQGTEINFAVTKNGSTARTEQVKIPNDGGIAVIDGITAPATLAGWAKLYVDITDGALKVLFGDGTIETIAPIVPSLDVENGGISIETGATKINFVGAGVTASNPAAGEVEVNIPGGGGGAAPEFAMVYKNTGQDFAINAWVNTTLDGFVHNGITGASITSGILTLPAGAYIIEGNAQIIRSNSCRIRLWNNTGAAVLCSGQAVWSGNATGTGVGAWAYPSLFGKFTLTVSSAVQIQQFIQSSTGAFTDNGFLADIGTLGFDANTQEFKITKIA